MSKKSSCGKSTDKQQIRVLRDRMRELVIERDDAKCEAASLRKQYESAPTLDELDAALMNVRKWETQCISLRNQLTAVYEERDNITKEFVALRRRYDAIVLACEGTIRGLTIQLQAMLDTHAKM